MWLKLLARRTAVITDIARRLALKQGTPFITTAAHPAGNDAVRNLCTARISDIGEMRRALDNHVRTTGAPGAHWARVDEDRVRSQLNVYRAVRGSNSRLLKGTLDGTV